MKRIMVAITAVLLALGGFVNVGATEKESEPWDFKWKNGFQLNSPDGMFKLKFGGRLQADWTFASATDAYQQAVDDINFVSIPVLDGNEIRRARIFLEGLVYEKVEFKVQYDFAGGEAAFKDVFIGFKPKKGVGSVRVGQTKEPFSLEELTSSKYITFLERSLNNVFAPARNVGVLAFNTVGERVQWSAGVYRESDDFADTTDAEGKVNVTARASGVPLWVDKGRKMIHVGLSLSHKDLGDTPFRWRQRPEVHQTPRIVNTGFLDADNFQIYDIELATVVNGFWAAAEYTVANGKSAVATDETNCLVTCTAGDMLGDPSFSAGYVQVGYFITGESRPYKVGQGSFSRVKPKKNLGEGAGAWEIAVRYSTLDLNDGNIAGGELTDYSVALNWYMNPVTRMMLNYVRADRTDVPDATADYFLMRFAIDF